MPPSQQPRLINNHKVPKQLSKQRKLDVLQVFKPNQAHHDFPRQGNTFNLRQQNASVRLRDPIDEAEPTDMESDLHSLHKRGWKASVD